MAVSCRITGCRGRASRFGRLCNAHKSRDRRHGDAGQHGVTAVHLKPYLKVARSRIKKNAQSRLWGQLEARWDALVGYCRDQLAEHRTGRPFIVHGHQAAAAVVKIAEDVKPRDVIETVIALYVMQDQEPRRFRSDRAFRAQLVRRVRALTDRNVGRYWDPDRGRTKRVYRDLPPRAVVVMGKWIAETLGVVGLKVAELERQDAEAKSAERKALGVALAELK